MKFKFFIKPNRVVLPKLLLIVYYLTKSDVHCFMIANNEGGFLVTKAWSDLGLRMEEGPPAMEGSCNCIEYAAADNRQGWPSSLAIGRGANNSLP
jgi:hypothetical protein